MKERPILFSASMVRAIIDGRKTQTRRVVRHPPPSETREVFTFHHPDPRTHYWAFDGDSLLDWAYPCPHGEIGDRLYVRETWNHSNHPFGPFDADCDVFYRADYLDDPLGPDLECSKDGIRREWRPSIHMPRSASRITLEVTGVRVERLQNISEADAAAEGIERYRGPLHWVRYLDAVTREPAHNTARDAFLALWKQLNGPVSVAANPWVWVIEFNRVEA